MIRWSSILAVAAAVIAAAVVWAEVPNRSPEQLRETATHVIVGDVVAIYSRQSREGSWQYTRFVAEIRVKSIEKGEGLQADRVIFARFFQRQYRGAGRIADTAGHRMLANWLTECGDQGAVARSTGLAPVVGRATA